MQTQPANRTTIQPLYPLSNEVKTASWCDLIVKENHIQPIMLGAEGYVIASKLILDLCSWETLFYGQDSEPITHQPAVSARHLMANGQQNTPGVSKNGTSPLKDEQGSREPQSKVRPAKEDGQMIQEAINNIFRYKQFRENCVMANNPLQRLVVVQQAQQSWLSERGLPPKALSERNQAHILREFLTKCLDEELCPHANDAPPEDLSKVNLESRSQWIEYLILRWQYVDDCSRDEVEKQLEKREYWGLKGGTYTRHLKAARERLATLIWQKEIRARKGVA